MKVYLAGGWFTPESAEHLENIRNILREENVPFYDPKNDNLFKPGMDPKEVVKGNIHAIDTCDWMVACVDRFEREWTVDGLTTKQYEIDVGTAIEVGMALSQGVKVVYVWFHAKPNERFNLMMAATGKLVTNADQLRDALFELQETGDMTGVTVDENIIE